MKKKTTEYRASTYLSFTRLIIRVTNEGLHWRSM